MKKLVLNNWRGSANSLAIIGLIIVTGVIVSGAVIFSGVLSPTSPSGITVTVEKHYQSNYTSASNSTPTNSGRNSIDNGVSDAVDSSASIGFELQVLTPSGSGVTSIQTGTHFYRSGYSLVVEAVPSKGWRFDHWEIDGASETSSTLSFVIESDHVIRAFFTKLSYSLQITSIGDGVTNPTNGVYELQAATLFPVQASGSEGWVFNHWVLDGVESSDNPILVSMDQDRLLEAIFSEEVNQLPIEYSEFNLNIISEGLGSTSPGAGYYTFANGTVIHVTANPDSDSFFDHWMLDGVNHGSNRNIYFKMDSDHTLIASFKQSLGYSLSILSSGPGSITRSPDQDIYVGGQSVRITATPDVGYKFSGWSGDYTGTVNPLTLLMNENKTVTANFVATDLYAIMVSTEGQGAVDLNPSQGSYVTGSAVQLRATPATGWVFKEWSGDVTGSVNPCSVIMDGNKFVTAIFIPDTFELIIQSPEGYGSVTPGVGTHMYDYGEVVQVSATPSVNEQFDHWVLDGKNAGNSNTIFIVMDAAHTLKPVFSSLVIGIYSDSACRSPITTIDWGTLQIGTISRYVYVKNLGTVSASLHCSFNNWAPSEASNYIRIVWNRENTILAPGASTQATFTLTVSDNIQDISTFNVDIDISATQYVSK